MAAPAPSRPVSILPPPHGQPLQQAFVLRLSEESLTALGELLRQGGEGVAIELGDVLAVSRDLACDAAERE